MSKSYIRRRLWYFDSTNLVKVEQDFLERTSRSLVVLGEAGMGKSTLFSTLKSVKGFKVCTARKLINTPEPLSILGDAETLVVDALDEVSSHRQGDAVDLVLQQLARLRTPRFILSCRIADWRSATGLQSIADFYDLPPIELHLDALSKDEAIAFLASTLNKASAQEAIDHLDRQGLSGLWHNPQTLTMVEKVAARGQLPESKGDLFLESTKLLRVEHREEKSGTVLATIAEEEVLDAAGASFAALIISGSEALSRKTIPDKSDISLADVSALPNAAQLNAIMDSRLFEAVEPERFTYTHRAIGEFLGARWLSKQADTARKRRRLLSLFDGNALVPNSLRGIYAWLAWHSQALANEIITKDPMGILEYGDANKLTAQQGRTLLNALYRLSIDNPHFRDWTEYRADGLVQPALLPEVREMITDSKVKFGLRLLLLQVLKHAQLDSTFFEILQKLVLDESLAFALRSEAGDRLSELAHNIDWTDVIRHLISTEDEGSARLAIELMDEIGYEYFDDPLMLEVVAANLARTKNTVGIFHKFEREVPVDRIAALLDGITGRLSKNNDRVERGRKNDAITDLLFALLERRLKESPPDPVKLWQWLRNIDPHRGFQKETRKSVASILKDNDDLRRSIQRHVLLDLESDKNIWQRLLRIPSVGLRPDDDDIIYLLNLLEADDPRWRELLQLSTHGPNEGERVREAAKRFAEENSEGENWLEQLSHPQVPEWQIEEEETQRKEEEERQAKWKQHRADFSKRIDQLRAGNYGDIVNPAKAYLKLFHDMGDEVSNGPDRIEEWLGSEIRDAALAGFEVFLTKEPPLPSANDIACGYAEGKRWNAAYILVAGLAERVRKKQGFSDLNDERLIAGYIELSHDPVHKHANLQDLDVLIEKGLRARGCWEEALRLLIEPQFERQSQHVTGLYNLMHSNEDAELAEKLGAIWLAKYSDLSEVAELEILDRLLSTPSGQAAIRSQLDTQLSRSHSDEKQLAWNSVGLILDFDATVSRLENSGELNPGLFWALRARTKSNSNSASNPMLDGDLASWIIGAFREVFPYTPSPNAWSGDDNPWDATSFITSLINLLGDDISSKATKHLQDLRDASEDGYTYSIRIALAEQQRKQVEANWSPPDLPTIKSIITDQAPTTSSQLQAVMLEELAQVQAKIRGSNVDWYKDFFDDAGSPRIEDDCRDTILKMLGELPFGIQASPEGHLADDKRCDIECTYQETMVPIELKGQWHKDVWTAADSQLDRLYTNDWRADLGIYVVLWFGPDSSKKVCKPPANVELPDSSEALRIALKSQSMSANTGRTEIVVLDLTRPS